MRREDPPGARWAYKDSDTEMIGWVLSNATGKSLARQLEESIWKRIGTEADASWTLDRPGGSESASSGLNATARDFARFGRLFLHEGRWQGQEIVPRDWVMTSTSVDRSRDEPEVTTWFRMQHQQYWWIPMHNWEAERDFFADGSKGQRLYVHRPSRTIIVQLADDSDQEFPFRKVVHYLAGEPFRYPTPIPALLLRAGRTATPDSIRALYRQLSARERANPAELVINEGGMIAVGIQLTADAATRPTGLAVLELSVERSPRSYRSRDALGDALLAAGDRQKAIEQYRRSVELAPFSTYAREKLAELERRP
jgi:CubicO group peptidase (beta-lactamase class C family)